MSHQMRAEKKHCNNNIIYNDMMMIIFTSNLKIIPDLTRLFRCLHLAADRYYEILENISGITFILL